MPQTIAKRRAAKGTHANRPPSKKAQPRRATEKVSVDEQGVRWLAAANGYEVALAGGKLAARNSKGKRLASVPPAVAQSEVGERLLALRDWLAQHERQCTETVETWMLRSLPIPRDVVQAVWPDPAWRRPLENLVVVPVKDGALELGSPGFLRGADPSKGVGVVNLDGETAWIRSEEVAVAHPILLPDLDDLRNMAAELKLTQGVAQLFRESFKMEPTADPTATSVGAYSDGRFEQLLHALGKARSLGYPVRGGSACCPVYEDGQRVEARYWLGAEYPEAETFTGDLIWVDARQRTLPLGEVGPVAYSEGVRMATAIYGARAVEKDEEAQ